MRSHEGFRKCQAMSRERFIQRKAELGEALCRLSEVLDLPETPVLRDAAIHRFEFTFELMWKTLQLYLHHQGFEAAGPRSVLRLAFEVGLVPTVEEGDLWMAMLEDRNQTTHTYSEVVAIGIFRKIKSTHAPLLLSLGSRIQSKVWEE